MYDIRYQRIDAPALAEMFETHRYNQSHTYDLRRVNMFRIPFHRTDYGFNEPVSSSRANFCFRIKSILNERSVEAS